MTNGILCTIRLVLLVAVCLSVLSPIASAADPSVHRIGVTEAVAPGGIMEALMFYGAAVPIVVAAVGICFSKNIVRMAVWLFLALGSVAVFYFLLAANFLGAIQLIVYVGGTLVLLIFGVMLTSKSPWVKFSIHWLELLSAAVVCISLFIGLSVIFSRATWATASGVVPGSSMADFGRRLITVYLVPFEVAGVLLFIVMVGAAHLARPEK